MNHSFNSYFKIYLVFILSLAIFYLFQKHTNLVEWNISEWLINYQGGFTRRGLIGEIVFQISSIFNFEPRKIIFLFQILTYTLYFYLLYSLIKDLKKNFLFILAIFSPIFLLYPLAEVEVLARKEIFLFISYIVFVRICSLQKYEKFKYYAFSAILAVISLIWEGAVFYFLFFILLLFLSENKNNFKEFFIKITTCMLPLFIVLFFIVFFKLSPENMKLMCKSVNECYGAMHYTSNTLSSNISEVTSRFKLSYFIRYILIYIIGFLPLTILCANSVFKNKFQNFSIIIVFLFTLLPSFILYFIAIDWGRWVNISYTLSFLTYVFLLKNNYIHLDQEKIKIIIKKYIKNKIILIFIFIIFSFGWNPKTLMMEDVGSFPGYRIIYKTFKNLTF